MNFWEQLLNNRMLIIGLIAWFGTQFIKVPLEFLWTHQWNWALWFSSGGMPSSHSALVSAIALSVGLYAGFDSAAFAIALSLAMIVLYDAAGVRREAGNHAQKINQLINEFFSGHPISEDQLKEVIGHTPRQVAVGTLAGLLTAVVIWYFWH